MGLAMFRRYREQAIKAAEKPAPKKKKAPKKKAGGK